MSVEQRKKATRNQLFIIAEFMEKHPDLNKGIFTPNFTSRDRVKLWNNLEVILNAEGGAIKSVQKWQKCWNDFKTDVKKKYIQRRNYVQGTGGGPPSKEFTELENKVVALIGMDAVEGLDVPESLMNPTLLPLEDSAEVIIPLTSLNTNIQNQISNYNLHNTNSTITHDACTSNTSDNIHTDTHFIEHASPHSILQDITQTPQISTHINNSKSRKRVRNRGMVISADKTDRLIAAQEETARGLKSLAAAMEEKNSLKKLKLELKKEEIQLRKEKIEILKRNEENIANFINMYKNKNV